ncbi:MAG: hypothetical protein AAGA58_11920 [Verrucomicrobiota bacterium]
MREKTEEIECEHPWKDRHPIFCTISLKLTIGGTIVAVALYFSDVSEGINAIALMVCGFIAAVTQILGLIFGVVASLLQERTERLCGFAMGLPFFAFFLTILTVYLLLQNK